MYITLINSELKAIIDDEDFYLVKDFRWRILLNGYATKSTVHEGENNLMHRVVLKLDLYDQDVDHIDQNKLNNSKSNLRLVSRSENGFNSKKKEITPWGKTTSKYKGVYFNARDNHFIAKTRLNGDSLYLFSSKVEEECAYAYDCATSYLGVMAYVNGTKDLLPTERAEHIKRKVESGIEFTRKHKVYKNKQ